MAFSLVWSRDWQRCSENWKQILTKDEYQIPDTTKGIIRGHCQGIERIYQFALTGLLTVEEKKRKEKLQKDYKDYKDLGQRVLNEAGKTDWNRVEEMLEGIFNEMQGIYFRDEKLRTFLAENARIAEAENARIAEAGLLDGLLAVFRPTCEVPRRLDRMVNDHMVRSNLGSPTIRKGMKINAETLEGEVVTVKNVTTFDLVRDVKDQIATKLGRKNPDEIIVLHQQEELKDTETLDSYGITNGTTLNVLPRVRGKGLLESAKFASDTLWDMMKRLVTWIPGLFADTTRAVTKQELGKISHLIGNGWEILANALGIDDVTLDHIKADNKTMAMQILEMLTTWINDIGSEATVGKLYKTMEECSMLRFKKEQIKIILSGAPPDL